jgi:hypothetical protein
MDGMGDFLRPYRVFYEHRNSFTPMRYFCWAIDHQHAREQFMLSDHEGTFIRAEIMETVCL